MIEHIVDDAYGCGRVDKYIMKLLPGMPKGLLYKQFRNKNITLNGRKIGGSEQVKTSDVLKFFLSDETFKAFSEGHSLNEDDHIGDIARKAIQYYNAHSGDVDIVYENEHIIVMDKPSGMLSQKSRPEDDSLNEWMLGYLLSNSIVKEDDLTRYKPSVLNRLDRNTSGLVIGGKTLKGANIISRALRERTVHKYYKTLVWGECTDADGIHEALLSKDSSTNLVNIVTELVNADNADKYAIIKTGIKLIELKKQQGIGTQSVLEIELFTGKSHQIRAHLSYLGYPIVGDPKYGNRDLDKKYGYSVSDGQYLHAYKIVFDDDIRSELDLDTDTIISHGEY